LKPKLLDHETSSSFISEKDDYIINFSEFDLQSRLGTSEKVSREDLLEFISLQTLDWTKTERETIVKIFSELEESYVQYTQYLLKNVALIKTTGREENDASYTRKNCIYIPLSMAQWPYQELKELIAHELFHIVSTNNPEFRNKWYAKLGFFPCPKLEIPKEFKNLYVTNPDTVGKNCYVEFQDNGTQVKAVPFLYSETPYRGGYFFRYLHFSFLVSELKKNEWLPVYEAQLPKLIDAPQKLYQICEEIDPYNNQHRLHPEEILAYYWSFLPFLETELEYNKRIFIKKISDLLQH